MGLAVGISLGMNGNVAVAANVAPGPQSRLFGAGTHTFTTPANIDTNSQLKFAFTGPSGRAGGGTTAFGGGGGGGGGYDEYLISRPAASTDYQIIISDPPAVGDFQDANFIKDGIGNVLLQVNSGSSGTNATLGAQGAPGSGGQIPGPSDPSVTGSSPAAGGDGDAGSNLVSHYGGGGGSAASSDGNGAGASGSAGGDSGNGHIGGDGGLTLGAAGHSGLLPGDAPGGGAPAATGTTLGGDPQPGQCVVTYTTV